MSERQPVIKPSQAIKALEKAGFFIQRQTGSHVILKHPAKSSIRVTVPKHNKDLKKGTLHNIIISAELTVEEFKEFL